MRRAFRLSGALVAALSLGIAGCAGPAAPAGDGGEGTDVTRRADAVTPSDTGPRDTGTPVIATDHPRIYLNNAAVRARLNGALGSGQRTATRFRDMVDRQLATPNVYAFQAWYAALLGQLTGGANYCRYAVESTDRFVTEEEGRIAATGDPEVDNDSYLEIGDIVGSLALTYDWCYASLTAAQRTRWIAYANQAVYNVWHPGTVMWGTHAREWNGWSVNNPSNNYYYSFLRATLLLGLAARGEHPDAAGWITMFRETKLRDQLFPAFSRDLVGGGSREGTGYGIAMAKLWELYDLWEASTGESISQNIAHTHESFVNFLHYTVPTLDRIAPVGDHSRDSSAELFDYHRNYAQILTHLFRTDRVAGPGRYFLAHSSVPEMGQPFMFVYDFLYDASDVPEAPLSALRTTYYAPGAGQLYMRSSWERDATWVHFVAGPYTESHAHEDQGSLMLFRGEWLAYDQNVLSHSGIHQEQDVHNLVRVIEGTAAVPQRSERDPARLLALQDRARYTYAAADVTPIYAGNAAVARQQREVVYLRPDVVVVFDRVDARAAGRRVWQLNSPVRPTIAGAVATFAGQSATLAVHRVLPAGATSQVFDWSTDAEMSGGFRLDATHQSADGRSRFLHVMAVDGAVASVAASPDGTRLGALITLADGGRATVRFEDNAPGGTLEIRDAGGAVVETATLGAGVEPTPVYVE